jgi:HSP20 family molecular chaperone IbpA
MSTTVSDLIEGVMNQTPVRSPLIPPYDTYNLQGREVIEFAIPGYDKDSLVLKVANGELSLSGNMRFSSEKRDYKYRGINNPCNFITRLNIDKDQEVEEAKYTDGILKVVLKRIDTMGSAPTIPIS